jgi:hypothetical protein
LHLKTSLKKGGVAAILLFFVKAELFWRRYMSKPIMSVASVDITLLKSNPPQLVVTSFGFVSTAGWKNGRLEPRFYIDFPSDGIQDFDFVADPPEGMALMVISPVAAKPIEWVAPPEYVKGVRVHSQSNKIEARIEEVRSFAAPS